MEIVALIAAFIVAFYTGRWLFEALFSGQDDFMRCLSHSFTPDFVSLFKGELFEDMANSFRLGLYLILIVASGLLTYSVIVALAGSVGV